VPNFFSKFYRGLLPLEGIEEDEDTGKGERTIDFITGMTNNCKLGGGGGGHRLTVTIV
jgi:hypothetical protein